MCAGHASKCSASTVTSSCMRLFIHVLAVPPTQPYHSIPTPEYDTNLCNQSGLGCITYTREHIALPSLWCHPLPMRKSLKDLFPTPTTFQRTHPLVSATSSVSTPLGALSLPCTLYTAYCGHSRILCPSIYYDTRLFGYIIHLKGSASRSEIICIETTICILSETPDIYLSLSVHRSAPILCDSKNNWVIFCCP